MNSLTMALKHKVEGIGGLLSLALNDTTPVWWAYTWVSPIVDLFSGLKMELSLRVTHDRFTPSIFDDIVLSITFIPEKQEDWSHFGFFFHPEKNQVYGFSLFQQLNSKSRRLSWGGKEYKEGKHFSSIIPTIDEQEKIKEKVSEILSERIRNVSDIGELVYGALKSSHYGGNPGEKLSFYRYQKIALKRLRFT